MTWTYQGQAVIELPDECVGYVYIITNLKNNKKYIGKKKRKRLEVKFPVTGKIITARR